VGIARIIGGLWESIEESTYDGRSYLSKEDEPDYEVKMSDYFVDSYMRVKNGIASYFQPQSICEIGVSSGISALAFLNACPKARYLGIDNRYEEEMRGVNLVSRAVELLQPYNAKVTIIDSQELNELPEPYYDLIHVDGDHSRLATYHDVVVAWKACSPDGWIVVDDARDSAVAAGVFDAIRMVWPSEVMWAYLHDTFTGNILIKKEMPRP
jgi:predicted O-methyltransferase YrrM